MLEFIVFGMMANPDPRYHISLLKSDSTIMNSYSQGPKSVSDRLETQRRDTRDFVSREDNFFPLLSEWVQAGSGKQPKKI
jgi:hypothetical protein